MSPSLDRLPIESPVMALEPEEGRTRVTFTRLAAIYYLRDDEPGREGLLAALERSLETGEATRLTYDLKTKCINGLA